uniref:Reverse transcriptase domain-containing protein n=1 Tax=Tanacetum cinerariifolium TaxID=118510 RepID=A0A699HD75_TANCI|nr:hypothetical protein [Tanacetum cinerariifolium]
MKDPGLFILPCRLGVSKPFDTLADLGSCVNLIPLDLFKNLNVGLLEEIEDVLGLADGTKSEATFPLLVGRGCLATANAVMDCKKAKITVGEGLTRSIFGVIKIDFGEENVPYWTTIGKRKSYKPRTSKDDIALGRHLKEIHVTWALFWKKRDKRTTLHKRRLEELFIEGGDGIRNTCDAIWIIKRPCQRNCDDV